MENSITAVNFVLCLFGGWICVCRMDKMTAATKPAIKFQYELLFTVFVASGISWTYSEPATFGQLLMTAAVVAQLALGFRAWRSGPPDYTART